MGSRRSSTNSSILRPNCWAVGPVPDYCNEVCDPACGSGHMLTYAFDLLYAIYEEQGYQATDIPRLILTHNLYGIEIDQRTASRVDQECAVGDQTELVRADLRLRPVDLFFLLCLPELVDPAKAVIGRKNIPGQRLQ